MNAASAARSCALALLMLAAAGACRDRNVSDEASQLVVSAPAAAPEQAPQRDMARRAAGKVAFTAAGRTSEASQAPSAPLPNSVQAPGAPRLIIRNGNVSVQVDSLERAMDAVRGLAASLGGYVGNVSLSTGEHQVRSASLEVKIPASRFDEAMAGMKPLGEVQHSNATAQDVGEEFVDVSARVANARRLEARLVTLLATRTGKLEDVLAVERELARVREEIERYEGRIRYLSTHIAISTIVATVHEKAPIIASQPGHNPIRQAFVNMWRNFVLFVAWGIEAMGVLIPVASIAVMLAFGWRRWRRTRIPAAASS